MGLLDKSKFWNNSHELSSEQKRLFEKFIPSSGKTDYLQTECFRAFSRVYYDFYNNGWCNSPIDCTKFLKTHFVPLIVDLEKANTIKNAIALCERLLYRIQHVNELSDEDYEEARDFVDVFSREDIIEALELIGEATIRCLLEAEANGTLVRTNLDIFEG